MIGFSGKWDSAGNTSVMQGRSYGLEYPENINLTASHGSMSINNATQGATGAAGRIISRAITEVPITGTLYYSVLIQADSTSLSMLAANQTYGIGFGKTSKMSNSTSTALPYDGVYFGFWKNASGTKGSLDYTSIILRVNGTNYVLLDSPEPGTTYLCVAQIEIGAGTDGAEIVSATVVDPEIPLLFTEERTITVEEELIAETSFTFINAGGLYATGNGFVYFDEIILSDTLEEAANMLDSSMPVLENTMVVLNEEEEFVFSTQIINGSGDIYALLRKAEEYTATNLVASAASNTTVSATLTGLPANTGYEYAALVEWAGSPVLVAGSRSFYTGDVWVEAVSNAEESGYVPGIFKISRDSADSATTFDLQVDYAVSGTAGRQKFPEMSGTVTIPAGMESVEVSSACSRCAISGSYHHRTCHSTHSILYQPSGIRLIGYREDTVAGREERLDSSRRRKGVRCLKLEPWPHPHRNRYNPARLVLNSSHDVGRRHIRRTARHCCKLDTDGRVR